MVNFGKKNMKKSRYEAAIKAVELGRACLLGYFGRISQIEEKDKAGLVSEADRTCEEIIKNELAKTCPDVDFLGEETSFENNIHEFQALKSGARWILDPLDGTTNFIHRFPIFCISLGLEVDGEIELAIIDAPMLKQRWTAIKGEGCYLNGKRCFVSKTNDFSKSLLSTGFYAEDKVCLQEQLQIFTKMVSVARGVRRPGAAAYDLALVSSGVFDLFWEKNLKPWDTAAGKLLVEEAGGVLRTYEGNPYTPFEKSIIAGNKLLVDNFLKLLPTVRF